MPRRTRRWIIGSALVLCAGVAAVVIGAIVLMGRPPAWWRPLSAADPATAELARQVENAVVSELHLARSAAPGLAGDAPIWRSRTWTLALDDDAASAWLTARLPRWLANTTPQASWPDEISGVQVSFVEGRIRIGVRIDIDGDARIISATCEPLLGAEGSLWMRARTVHIGRLALPGGWLLGDGAGIVQTYVPEQLHALGGVQSVLAAFRGDAPFMHDPLIRIEGGRRVRICALAVRDGYLLLTLQTEQK